MDTLENILSKFDQRTHEKLAGYLEMGTAKNYKRIQDESLADLLNNLDEIVKYEIYFYEPNDEDAYQEELKNRLTDFLIKKINADPMIKVVFEERSDKLKEANRVTKDEVGIVLLRVIKDYRGR